jgi:glycosyltransferase involved in cell wall biosynthesis
MSSVLSLSAGSHTFSPSLYFPSGTSNQTRTSGKAAPEDNPAGVPIGCLCHLRGDGGWQRPQQLLSRLALNHPVLFVETYCSEIKESFSHARAAAGHPGVTVLEMHLPGARWHDGAFIDAERRRLLKIFFHEKAGRYDRPILWFNDPMAVVAFGRTCDERAIVYDCMDELAQFRGAPPGLRERERELLCLSDVVFCGGRKMRERRLPLNPNCHFYGTGVDNAHFGAARTAAQAVDPAIAQLPGKVLGYFGVIDERIDYELLIRLADADPSWSIAMVGPSAKIDPASLPQRENLFWLGARNYAQLPAIAKGFAVCLMPFALNEATEFINPTKALEYMATGRPVVSTQLDEVKFNFSSECLIAASHDEFVAFCREQIAAPDEDRILSGIDLAAAHSWEATVESMERHLYAAVLERSRRQRNLNAHV